MNRVERLAWLGGCVVVATVGGCRSTARPSSLAARAPAPDIPVCAGRAGRRIVVAIAESTDSAATDASRAVVASGVLKLVANALGPIRCGDRAIASLGATRGAMRRDSSTDDHTAAEGAIDVRTVAERDGRDALDAGVDVLVTRDPDVIGYAASRGDLVPVPLGWDRTYVLIMPARHQAGADTIPDPSPLRSALATDAVRVEARPFTSARWVASTSACDRDALRAQGAGSTTVAAPTEARPVSAIIYLQEDNVARGLGQRIAVLASTANRSLAALAPGLDPTGAEISAIGVTGEELARTLAPGTGAITAAYIVAVPSPSSGACELGRQLVARMPSLSPSFRDRAAEAIPLIETRARAIVRRDALARIGAIGDSMPLAQSGRARP